MAINQLKQSLWLMKEILAASPRGITREELSSKWARSYYNDRQGEGISYRTFYRHRKTLESVFEVSIECTKDGYNRYRVSSEDQIPGCHSILDLVMFNTPIESIAPDKTSSLKQIMGILTSGNPLTSEDKSMLNQVYHQVGRARFDCGERMRAAVEAGAIRGANMAEWDPDYKYYILLWDEEVYARSGQWLAVGLLPTGIYFYVVSDVEDSEIRERRAAEVGATKGVLYTRGYWWHKMEEPEMFCLPTEIIPDYDKIVKHCERILARLAEVK